MTQAFLNQQVAALNSRGVHQKNVTTQRVLDLYLANLPVIKQLLPLLGFKEKPTSDKEVESHLPKTQRNQMIASLVDQFK